VFARTYAFMNNDIRRTRGTAPETADGSGLI
jgi:hypothetical protein